MASGTVTYTAAVPSSGADIYPSGASFPVTGSGSFPATPYRVTEALLRLTIGTPGWNTDLSGRAVEVSGNGVIGTLRCGQQGSQSAPMNTGANYEGISSLTLRGTEGWACTLSGGSMLSLEITWEDEEPEITDPEEEADPLKEPVNVITGTVLRGGEKTGVMVTEPVIAFEGVDISAEIKKYLLSMSFTDNEEDETDDLQIRLQDAAGLWLQKWLNASLQASLSGGEMALGGKTKGMKITAGIRCVSPDGTLRQTDCGTFTLDSLKASGPPSAVTVKASSLPFAAGMRTEERDKAWEEYTLSGIGAEIAKKAGLGFLYDASGDPEYKRVEQAKETDIAFLQRLCHDAGYSLKVSSGRLVIFEQAKYEALAAVLTISWMDGSYTKYDLSTTEGDVTFAKCEVRYFDPDTKKTIIGIAESETFDAEDENNQTLVITDHRVTSIGEADALAAQLLRLHNKFEREINFTLVGNPLLAAGLCVELSGFGLWDGKYLLRQVRHDISASGYTTRIKGRCVYAHTVEKTKKPEAEGGGGDGGQTKAQETEGGNKWVLRYSVSVFSLPPGQDGSQSLGLRGGETEVDILGSSSGGYTLVSVGGLQGYIPTDAIKKKEVK